jgi:tetratricopeptide (TPR) repeat protein
MLEDKRYKEAVIEFSKSFSLNPGNYDALFYRAVANLDFGQPHKSIEDLSMLLEKCPDYRKTVYIVMSIAYRRINDYNGALRILSKALGKYPRYTEACIARGQIYIFQ